MTDTSSEPPVRVENWDEVELEVFVHSSWEEFKSSSGRKSSKRRVAAELKKVA